MRRFLAHIIAFALLTAPCAAREITFDYTSPYNSASEAGERKVAAQSAPARVHQNCPKHNMPETPAPVGDEDRTCGADCQVWMSKAVSDLDAPVLRLSHGGSPDASVIDRNHSVAALCTVPADTSCATARDGAFILRATKRLRL